MNNTKTQKPLDDLQKITQLFAGFSQSLQNDAKRFNEERQKTKKRLTNGTRLTAHRINL